MSSIPSDLQHQGHSVLSKVSTSAVNFPQARITEDLTQFDYVLATLDNEAAVRIIDIIPSLRDWAPPKEIPNFFMTMCSPIFMRYLRLPCVC